MRFLSSSSESSSKFVHYALNKGHFRCHLLIFNFNTYEYVINPITSRCFGAVMATCGPPDTLVYVSYKTLAELVKIVNSILRSPCLFFIIQMLEKILNFCFVLFSTFLFSFCIEMFLKLPDALQNKNTNQPCEIRSLAQNTALLEHEMPKISIQCCRTFLCAKT